jgi:hypothetical protein
MDWAKFAEEKIKEAMATGEMEPKTGKGKPLEMDEYFAPRDEDRMAYHVLRSSGHVPQEVYLMSELTQLRASLKTETNAERRRELTSRLIQVETEWNLSLQRRQSRAPK